MRIFVSYARVDKPYCLQIVQALNSVNDVWHDQRLAAGQEWWREIESKVKWCDCFIYLLSPESVTSEYCQRECSIALAEGKAILPFLIRENTSIPHNLSHLQCQDLSGGLTTMGMNTLLSALVTLAENKEHRISRSTKIDHLSKTVKIDTIGVYSEALRAIDNKDFDAAVYKLRQLSSEKSKIPYTDIEDVLRKTERELKRQVDEREAQHNYEMIRTLMKSGDSTLACERLVDFRIRFPDYDPDDLFSICDEANFGLTPDEMSNDMDILFQNTTRNKSGQLLVVNFERSADGDRDLRRFNKLFQTITSYPGQQSFEISVDAHRIEYPHVGIDISEALLRALHKLVGADNVQVAGL
jgi:hypothetical protein